MVKCKVLEKLKKALDHNLLEVPIEYANHKEKIIARTKKTIEVVKIKKAKENDNLLTSEKGVYDYVVYDSTVEREFAEKLETNKDVLVYVKLPSWFKIPTPLGSYNPDWAILINDAGKRNSTL